MLVMAAMLFLPLTSREANERNPCHAPLAYQSRNFQQLLPSGLQDAPMIHLSYHDGEHYNSVREASDFGRGPPREQSLGTRTASGADAAQLRKSWGLKEVQLVKQGTGCDDTGPVEWALSCAEGQVDEVRFALILEGTTCLLCWPGIFLPEPVCLGGIADSP